MNSIIYNAEIVSGERPQLKLNNRAFNYGDGLFESVLYHKGNLVALDAHLERMRLGMESLHMRPNAFLKAERFEPLFEELAANNEMDSAKVRISVFRDSEGFYTPEGDDTSFSVMMYPLEKQPYEFNAEGLSADICKTYRKSFDPWSNYKTSSALGFVLASIEARDSEFDELFILNTAGRLCEGLSSNVFLTKGNQVWTPSLEEACLAGTMRDRVAKLAHELGYEVESRPVEMGDLFNADEVFVTNAIGGVRWVSSFRDRRYYHKVSSRISEALRKSIQ